MRALDHGPAHLPHDLFAGAPERVVAAMKVHANTISHARLVALEDTFPRTRAAIGHDRFNALSRSFVEQPGVTARPIAEIGRDFDQFLTAHGEGEATADIARFEWFWLAAYHAPDVDPVTLAELAEYEPAVLMEQRLVCHPAACAGQFNAAVPRSLGAEIPGLADAAAILIARPHAEVLISPATLLMEKILGAARNPASIGNLVASASETWDASEEATAQVMEALVALLNAGALARG
mgnify:CR=1 FL=1